VPKRPNNVTSRPILSSIQYSLHLLLKDLWFEHGGATLTSCPGRHPTSLRVTFLLACAAAIMLLHPKPTKERVGTTTLGTTAIEITHSTRFTLLLLLVLRTQRYTWRNNAATHWMTAALEYGSVWSTDETLKIEAYETTN